jgi:hypothetical protein
VGWFFVPVMNLFKPLLATQELWKASDASTAAQDPLAWKQSRGAILVIVWWSLLLASGVLGGIAWATGGNPSGGGRPSAFPALIDMVSQLLFMGSAVCLALIILKVQQKQRQKATMVQAASLPLQL